MDATSHGGDQLSRQSTRALTIWALTMAKILFAWELGGGSGHIHIIGPLALALHQRGHEVWVAVRDVAAAEPLLSDSGIRVLQAPYWAGRVGGLPPSASFPEVLLRVGYLDPEVLTALVRAWISLFDLCNCDLVLAEHAPTALLAAQATNRPRIIMGTGFSVPPATDPMPSVEAWRQSPAGRLAQAESTALDGINGALAAHGAPPLGKFLEMLQARETILCTVPELDHYGLVRAPVHHWGPLTLEKQFPDPIWPSGTGPKIFAYMHSSYAQFRWVARALASTGYPVLLIAGGARASLTEELSTATLRVQSAPVSIRAAAEQASVVVSHSPHGTLWDVLRTGTPQLLVPAFVEQVALGYNFVRHGAALLVGAKEGDAPAFHQALNRLLNEPAFGARAQALAQRYSSFDSGAQLEEMYAVVVNTS